MFRITLWLLVGLSTAQAQLLNQRLQVSSKILDRPHELLVYTPPSYDYDQDQRYPVLYLMDGEYNLIMSPVWLSCGPTSVQNTLKWLWWEFRAMTMLIIDI